MDTPHAFAAVLLYRLVAFWWCSPPGGWRSSTPDALIDHDRSTTDRRATDRPATGGTPAELDLSPHTAVTSGQDRR